MGAIYRLLFAITERETSFGQRGFRGGQNGRREHLEKIGAAFVDGYNSALDDSRESALMLRLEKIESDLRGFAYEGAAMALGLLDRLTPWRRDRVHRFLNGPGSKHTYMIHVALGWVTARFRGSIGKTLDSCDPLLRWLVFDGYGFHEGFFHWQKYIHDGQPPKRVTGYARRVFDQGLGRSWWFVDGGTVARIRETIAGFSEPRRADLWSGIGLASVYAGELCEGELKDLIAGAGEYYPHLAQGAAFAAKARHRAGNPTRYTDRACWTLCGMSSADAATATDAALESLLASGGEEAYEIWRQRIQKLFSTMEKIKR